MMNRKALTRATSLTLASAIAAISLVTVPQIAHSQAQTITPKIAMAQGTARGRFVTGEKKTQGNFQIVSMNGKQYLELDQSFSTGPGPDVLVLLHRSSNPKSYSSADYINLGFLKQTQGYQRYEIPSDIDVSQFQSVSIWCRQFNATFGHAPFSS